MLLIKWGHYRGHQRWRCGDCGHVFSQPKSDWILAAYRDYVLGKQTLAQLGKKLHKTAPTLRKHFDSLRFDPRILPPPLHPVSLIFDTTFFGHTFGVLVFRAEGRNIFWQFVRTERAEDIRHNLARLHAAGWQFKSITVDGKPSILQMLRQCYPDIPVQICQFHVMQNLRRILSAKPKTSAGKELLMLTEAITRISRAEFTDLLLYFAQHKYKVELGSWKEREARKAIKTIQNALPFLFACQDYPERNIPNTTNSCEGSFGQWKIKIRIHRGTTTHRKQKMISFLLAN